MSCFLKTAKTSSAFVTSILSWRCGATMTSEQRTGLYFRKMSRTEDRHSWKKKKSNKHRLSGKIRTVRRIVKTLSHFNRWKLTYARPVGSLLTQDSVVNSSVKCSIHHYRTNVDMLLVASNMPWNGSIQKLILLNTRYMCLWSDFELKSYHPWATTNLW